MTGTADQTETPRRRSAPSSEAAGALGTLGGAQSRGRFKGDPGGLASHGPVAAGAGGETARTKTEKSRSRGRHPTDPQLTFRPPGGSGAVRASVAPQLRPAPRSAGRESPQPREPTAPVLPPAPPHMGVRAPRPPPQRAPRGLAQGLARHPNTAELVRYAHSYFHVHFRSY